MSGRRTASSALAAACAVAAAALAGPAAAAEAPSAPRHAEAPSAPIYGVERREAWIPLPDGVRLAADLFVPTGGGADERFPVLLEYLPYRKAESRARNHALYAYFVRRGYVVARVDIRGTGESEGRLIEHEYSEREQADGEAVIDWLSKQPFSTGRVGMFGISWGGFNAIHMAMRNPPALGAIVAVDAADDLYQDDVHFIDGIIHVDSWEMSQDLDNSRPGAPEYRIDEDYFRDRFDAPPWMLTYKRQQRDGPFWDRTAPKARYESVRVPAFLIGGWYDGYRDSVPRMLEHLRVPVKAILGPWGHDYPHNAVIEPRIEWRHEAVRWYDQWLKGRDTGILDEPRFAFYVRRWHPPGPVLERVEGEWRWAEGWPIAGLREWTLHPQPDRGLAAEPPAAHTQRLRRVPSTGVEAGGPVMWWGDAAHDQRPTDAFSLVYDTPPLEEDVEILGFPRAELRVSADAPLAHWFARLSDVAPEGAVTLVTGAGANGAHRHSARQPEPIEPGRPFGLDVEMHFTSWVFPKGHRIRLSVGNSQWPMFWPSPHPTTTSLHLGGPDATRLVLPLPPAGVEPRPAFLDPEPDPPGLPGFETLDAGSASGYGEVSSIDRDPQRGTTRVQARNRGGARHPWGTEWSEETIVHEVADAQPEAASVRAEHRTTVELGDRTLVWESLTAFWSDRESFHYDYTRRLLRDGAVVREKSWKDVIPRDHQ